MNSTIVLEKENPIKSTNSSEGEEVNQKNKKTSSLPANSSPTQMPTDAYMTDAYMEQVAPSSRFAIVLTVEIMLWLLFGVVALGMRIISLAYWPLSESEAALAYEAWRFVTGNSHQMSEPALSPLAFNLEALLFVLFGANDGLARVAQALAGTALVLSPWYLRPIIGRAQALAMSALLLISPSVLFWSRQASGEVWAALCALLLVAGSARWWQKKEPHDAVLASLALGVGLASGAGFWTVLLAGLLFLAWWRKQQKEAVRENSMKPSEAAESPFRDFFMRYGLITFFAFIMSATGFLSNLQGFGAAFNLPIEWLKGLFGVGPSLVLPFFFVLLLYELLIVLLGVIGGLQLLEKQAHLTLFCALWIATTLLPTTLTNSGWAAGILFITLPMTLLASAALINLVNQLLEEGSWDVDGLLMGLGGCMFFYFWINISSYIAEPSPQKLLASTIVPLVAFLSTTLIIANYQNFKGAQRALSLTLLLLLTITTFSSSWGLSLVRANDAREPLVVQPSDPNLRAVAAQLGQISIERYRNASDIAVGIQQTLGYAARWYFRHFDQVTLIDGSHADLPEAALLDSQQPPPPKSIGQHVWLGTDWQLIITEPIPFLHWLKTRQEPTGLIPRSAVLYVMLP